jgi:hypothetical protein
MGLADSTLGLLDYAWSRIRGRLDGMTDEEYLWEPVPVCWSVRLAASGKWEVDRVDPPPSPPPVTTIGWRTWHIGSECLGGFAHLLFGAHPPTLEPQEWYPTATEALGATDLAWTAFADGSHRLDDEAMAAKLGPDWGPWAESNRADAILHVADEIIHHGAEVALLRDLYAANRAGG